MFFGASCPVSTDPNPLWPTRVLTPLPGHTRAGNCLVPRFQDRPARGQGTPTSKGQRGSDFSVSQFGLAGWMIPAFGAEQQLPGKLILSIVDFCRRLQLCVVRWPSLQPHRVQCYAAECPLTSFSPSLSYRVCPSSALLCSPLLVCSRASWDKRSALLLLAGHGQDDFRPRLKPKSSQVEVRSRTRSQEPRSAINYYLVNPTNSST